MDASERDKLLLDPRHVLRTDVLTDPPPPPHATRGRRHGWRPVQTVVAETEPEVKGPYRAVLRCRVDVDTD